MGSSDLAIPGSRAAARVSRHARLVCVGIAALVFGTFPEPEILGDPFTPLTAFLALSAALLVTNCWSWTMTGREDSPVGLRRAMEVEVALDLAAACVLLFALRDGSGAQLALVVLPVLEAALRLGSRAARVTWAASAMALVLTAVGSGRSTSQLAFIAGLAFVVASSAGGLADRLAAQLALAGTARSEADRRADLLRIAASATRRMATVETEQVLDAVLEGVRELGFGAGAVRLAQDDGTWPMVRSWNVPLEAVDSNVRAESGLMGAVRRSGATLVIDDYSTWPEQLAAYREEQAGTAVAVPIRAGDEIVGVLGTGTRVRRRISAAEVECLELLAASAGAALDAARHFRRTEGLQARLVHQASHDRLTGLPNRAAFLDSVATALTTPDLPAVLVCDLDGFKTLNDSLGHQAGDRLLDAVGARLERTVGAGCPVARLGGDEFAVLVPGGGHDAGVSTGEAILARLGRFEIEGHDVVVTASVGIAVARPGDDAVGLLRDAGLALVRAKQSGRGRCELFDLTLRQLAEERLALEVDLRKTLADGDLHVAYQPLVELASGRIIAVEALARWTHPERGAIPPDVFIPLAEETGLIGALGREVLEQACAAACTWDGPRVSVNLSAVQIATPGIDEVVAGVLRDSGLAPGQLTLEITEGVVMDDVPEVLEAVRALSALGVRLSLDDFGKGWSSLSYLTRYPLDELKIDRAFVDGVAERPADRAVVRSLVVLAHDLGLDVVAEGIEDPRQLAELTGLGCDAGQGYLLYRPMTADAVAAVLRPGRALRVV